MPAKTDVGKLVGDFKDKADDWDCLHELVVELLGENKKVNKQLTSRIETTYEKVMTAFDAVRKADPNYKTAYPDVEIIKKKIDKELVKTLQESGDESVPQPAGQEAESKESADSLALNDLVSELDAVNEIIEAAELRLQKQYNQVPEPTNVSVSLVNKAYESVKEAEKNVTGVYVKLKVLLNRVTGYEAQREATKKKYLDITTGIADKLAVAEEYVAKYQYPYVQPGLVEDKNNAPGQDITAGVVTSSQTSA